jgi:RNA polymerase sigma factor (sigma-70 family)
MKDATYGADARRGSLGTAAERSSMGDVNLPAAPGSARADAVDYLVAELFRTHRLALVRVALLLVGDTPTAEDVVQEAFIGLYRAARRLTSTDKALAYVRTSVVNGCRSVHRARSRALLRQVQYVPPVWSAEAAVLAREESKTTLQAFSRLAGRAREVLALRYYLELTDAEIAEALGVSKSTVSSTASRALATLGTEIRGMNNDC